MISETLLYGEILSIFENEIDSGILEPIIMSDAPTLSRPDYDYQ